MVIVACETCWEDYDFGEWEFGHSSGLVCRYCKEKQEIKSPDVYFWNLGSQKQKFWTRMEFALDQMNTQGFPCGLCGNFRGGCCCSSYCQRCDGCAQHDPCVCVRCMTCNQTPAECLCGEKSKFNGEKPCNECGSVDCICCRDCGVERYSDACSCCTRCGHSPCQCVPSGRTQCAVPNVKSTQEELQARIDQCQSEIHFNQKLLDDLKKELQNEKDRRLGENIRKLCLKAIINGQNLTLSKYDKGFGLYTEPDLDGGWYTGMANWESLDEMLDQAARGYEKSRAGISKKDS